MSRDLGSPTKLDVIQYIEYCIVHNGRPPGCDEIADKLQIKREVMAVHLSRYVRNGVLEAIRNPGEKKRYGIGRNAFGEVSGREWRELHESGDSGDQRVYE